MPQYLNIASFKGFNPHQLKCLGNELPCNRPVVYVKPSFFMHVLKG